MAHDVPTRPAPRNGAGGAAFVLGLLALVCAFLPVVGEFIAAPAALLAVVLSLVGLRRVENGTATNTSEAVGGGILGVVAGLVMLLVYAASIT